MGSKLQNGSGRNHTRLKRVATLPSADGGRIETLRSHAFEVDGGLTARPRWCQILGTSGPSKDLLRPSASLAGARRGIGA